LNPRFGVGGLVTTSFGANEFATAVATEPDGKIVVAGTDTALDFSFSQIAIARYNRDGSLDNSFGTGGKVLTLIGPSDFVLGAIVRPDGKIIVDAGEVIPNTFQLENLLVQYNLDGTLDTSFGSGGTVVTPGFLASFTGNPITLSPQGKIVVVGSNSNTFSGMAVAEFNLDGSPNQNFGSGGIATFSSVQGFPTIFDQFGVFAATPVAVAVDFQGRVLVGGTVNSLPVPGSPQAALFRLTPDGKLDNTFGFNGSITNVFGFLGNEITAIAIRPNGQIVVAGQASNPNTIAPEDFAVQQFNPDGTPDLRFGFDSIVGTTIPNVNLYATGLAIQASGDIVVVGGTADVQNFFNVGFAMTRYTPDGNLDPTFGTNGIVTTFFPQTTDRSGNGTNVTNVSLTPDGNIVVAGTVVDSVTGNDDFGVAEYLGRPPAPPSPPFPSGLPAPVPPPLYPPFPIVPQPPQPPLGPNGRLNPAFGNHGTITSGPNVPASAAGVATQTDGKIVAVGDSTTTGGIVVVRYNPDGSLDQSFGTGGVVNAVIGNSDFFGSVVVQSDGKIVIAAEAMDPVTGLSDILVLRLNPDGSFDQTFGSGGSVTTALPNGQNFTPGGFPNLFTYTGNAITLTADGRIIIAGTASTGVPFAQTTTGLVIAEYDQHGKLVQGFGSGGLVIATSFTDSAGNTFTAPEANGVTVDSRGRILVAGSAANPSNIFAPSVAVLARYNSDGSPDQSFGFQGAVTSVFDVAGSNVFVPTGNFATAVAVRPDGKIIVAGNAIDPGSQIASFAVEQFNRDGSPDLNFGSHALALWSVGDGFGGNLIPTALVLQRDGSIVVAGSTTIFQIFSFPFNINGFGMIRLRPDGTFDSSFGSNGVVTSSFFSGGPIMMAQRPNGNLVVEGTIFDQSAGAFELGLAEYTAEPPGPSLAAGFALPSGAILARAGGGLAIGAPAALLSAASSAASQANGPASPTISVHSVAAASLASGNSSTRTAAFFAAFAGAAVHVPSDSVADALGALEPSAIDAMLASLL
jgi:uncharacterized delta-60 repeat protein